MSVLASRLLCLPLVIKDLRVVLNHHKFCVLIFMCGMFYEPAFI